MSYFFDSSALTKLFSTESGSEKVIQQLKGESLFVE